MLLPLYNVVKKELRQTLRDTPMVRMLILAPVLQLLLFGYAINMDVDKIPTVICDQDKTLESRDLVSRFLGGGTFLFLKK
jgi:ABC-2 type transport system permease protein